MGGLLNRRKYGISHDEEKSGRGILSIVVKRGQVIPLTNLDLARKITNLFTNSLIITRYVSRRREVVKWRVKIFWREKDYSS